MIVGIQKHLCKLIVGDSCNRLTRRLRCTFTAIVGGLGFRVLSNILHRHAQEATSPGIAEGEGKLGIEGFKESVSQFVSSDYIC